MNEELEREIIEKSNELIDAVEELESYIPSVSGEEGEELAEHVECCIDSIVDQTEIVKRTLKELQELLNEI